MSNELWYLLFLLVGFVFGIVMRKGRKAVKESVIAGKESVWSSKAIEEEEQEARVVSPTKRKLDGIAEL